MSDPLLLATSAFFVTLLLLLALVPLAARVGLVDEPDHRKPHKGRIPLVGGLAIFLCFLVHVLVFGWPETTDLGVTPRIIMAFLLGAALLVATGIIDDLRGMSVRARVTLEVVVALIIIEGIGLKLQNLGDLVGLGPVLLADWVAYPFLVIAFFGIINAYNILDGMDGLLSFNMLITLVAFCVLGSVTPGPAIIIIAGSLLAFLLSNLALLPGIPKTFLGDAGSKFLGLIVVCILVIAASGSIGEKEMAPVTALYVAGLPLMDMVFVTLKRVAAGRSPFTPERTHVHHLTRALGLSTYGSLGVICGVGILVPLLGLMLQRLGASEPLQFGLFLGLFALYCAVMTLLWRVADGTGGRVAGGSAMAAGSR